MRVIFPICLFVGLLSTPFLSHASDESPFQEYAKIFDTHQRLCMLQKQLHAMREHADTCDVLWETYQPYLSESLYTAWHCGRTEEESKEEKLKHIDTFSRALGQEIQLAQHEMKTYCFDHGQYQELYHAQAKLAQLNEKITQASLEFQNLHLRISAQEETLQHVTKGVMAAQTQLRSDRQSIFQNRQELLKDHFRTQAKGIRTIELPEVYSLFKNQAEVYEKIRTEIIHYISSNFSHSDVNIMLSAAYQEMTDPVGDKQLCTLTFSMTAWISLNERSHELTFPLSFVLRKKGEAYLLKGKHNANPLSPIAHKLSPEIAKLSRPVDDTYFAQPWKMPTAPPTQIRPHRPLHRQHAVTEEIDDNEDA